MKNSITFLTALFFISLFTSVLYAEYYQYVNEDGVLCFTDDKGSIPESHTDTIKTHKERFDGIDDSEKMKIIEREQDELKQIRNKRQQEIERYNQINRIQAIKQAEIERKKKLEKMNTPVKIANNQILVPVTLCYSDRTVNTNLVLDTGASITVIESSVAETLKITSGKRSSARVAGGGIVKSKLVDLQYIRVGPKTLKPHKVMIIAQKGPETHFKGLLGLDFLRRFDYSIDYANQLIRWKE